MPNLNHVKKEWLIVMINGKKQQESEKKHLIGSAGQQRGPQLVAYSMSKRLPFSKCSFKQENK